MNYHITIASNTSTIIVRIMYSTVVICVHLIMLYIGIIHKPVLFHYQTKDSDTQVYAQSLVTKPWCQKPAKYNLEAVSLQIVSLLDSNPIHSSVKWFSIVKFSSGILKRLTKQPSI